MYEELLNTFKRKEETWVCEALIKKIEEHDKPLAEWTTTDFDYFFKSLGLISRNSVLKYLDIVRKIYKYVCEKENVKCEGMHLSEPAIKYIDYKKLRSTIITREDYKFIRDELDFLYDGKLRNVRDKVIFELAWETLSARDIRNLKVNDITKHGEKIKIQLKNRVIWIDDPIVIKDIELCKNEYEHYDIDKRGYCRVYNYKISDYLIKPVDTRTGANEDGRVINMSIIWKTIAKHLSVDIGYKSRDYDGTEHVLDLEYLTIEGVKRSRILELLHQKHITPQIIQSILGKSQYIDIKWLQEISNRIYGNPE